MNDNQHSVSSKISDIDRRRFLKLTALGVAGMSLWGQKLDKAMANTLAVGNDSSSNTTDLQSSNDLSQTLVQTPGQTTNISCIRSTISTRLFSSSNAGLDEARNQRGLQRLSCAGFDIQNPQVTRRQYLRFAGTDQQRISDLQNIATGGIAAPKLLMAIRGGYGAIRLLQHVDWPSLGRILKEQGSIMAGFSDVTALQCALLARGGMSSLSAPMLYSEFGKSQPDKVSCQGFVNAITNPNLVIDLPPQQYSNLNKPLSGILWGGNLSIVSSLVGSLYLPKPKGGIVFLEEVGEQPYKIERMLYTLHLAGAFKHQQAIVFGAVSRTGEDSYDARYDMGEVINQLKRITGLPVFTGLPFGHVARKQSFPIGTMCTLMPTSSGIALEFRGYPTIDGSLINAEGLWA